MTELPNRLLRDALDDAASSAKPSGACVDADTLAAWADGTLTGTERSAVETHAAGCARCLTLLAAMARIEPAPSKRSWWRSAFAWLPLATVAAALVIVVRMAVIEQQPPVPTAVRSSDSTGDRQLPATVSAGPPAPSAQPSAPPASSTAADSPRRERSAVSASTRAPVAAAQPKPELPAAPLATSPPPAALPVSPAPPGASPAATNVASAPTNLTIVTTTPAPAAPPSAVRDELTRRQDGARALAASRMMMKAAASAPILIASPDRDSQWRIAGETVEHTVDGGATWQAQSIGVVMPIHAGAAPQARICWVVGAAGVVLRTVDGTTWTRIPFPDPADLVAIQASDALHATVTTAAGGRFTTSDGGRTWTRE